MNKDTKEMLTAILFVSLVLLSCGMVGLILVGLGKFLGIMEC